MFVLFSCNHCHSFLWTVLDKLETEVASVSLSRSFWTARRQIFSTGHGVREHQYYLTPACLLFPLLTCFHGHQMAGLSLFFSLNPKEGWHITANAMEQCRLRVCTLRSVSSITSVYLNHRCSRVLGFRVVQCYLAFLCQLVSAVHLSCWISVFLLAPWLLDKQYLWIIIE